MGYEKKKGRRIRGEPFVLLPLTLLNSHAYRALASSARSLLTELVAIFKGNNNGELFLGGRDAALLMGVDPGTAYRAFDKLEEHGFIRVAIPGSFGRKQRHATSWRLTWLPAGGNAPTHEYRAWRPEAGSREQARLMRLGACNLQSAKPASAAWKIPTDAARISVDRCGSACEIHTDQGEERLVSVAAGVGEIRTHIDCQLGPAPRASYAECKKARKSVGSVLARAGHGAQGRLAGAAGLSASRLSRFLSDPAGHRTLTVDELGRLEAAAIRLSVQLGPKSPV